MNMFVQMAFAAAWLQPQYAGVFVLQGRPAMSCHYWTQNGQFKNSSCFKKITMDTYFEYGLLPWFTFVIDPSFNAFRANGNISGFGPANLMTAGRFQFWKKNYDVVSLQVGYNQRLKSKYFGIVGSSNNSSPLEDQNAFSGEQNYMDIRLMYGIGGVAKNGRDKSATVSTIGTARTTQPNTWYADVQLAFQPYFEGPADLFHLDFLYGIKFFKQTLELEFKELNTITLNNPSVSNAPNYNLFSVVGSLTYWFNKYVALRGGMQQDFFGTNTGMGTAAFGAFVWQF